MGAFYSRKMVSSCFILVLLSIAIVVICICSVYMLCFSIYLTNSISLPVAMALGLYLISLCEPVVSELVKTFLSQMLLMMLCPNYIIF